MTIERTTSRAEGGFDDAYRRWYPDVFRYVRRRVGDDLAPDVTAEVFVVAWRRWDRLDEADLPLAWLYGVARKCVGNARRGRDRRRALVDRAAIGAHHTAPDDRAEVLEALSHLSVADQEVLMLTAWEGLDGTELAVALGTSEATARKRLSRARARLAAVLEGDRP